MLLHNKLEEAMYTDRYSDIASTQECELWSQINQDACFCLDPKQVASSVKWQ